MNKLRQILPCATGAHVFDAVGVYVGKSVMDLASRLTLGCKSSNLPNVLWCQFGKVMLFVDDGMQIIFTASQVFQIAYAVITSYAILVIQFFAGRTRAEKCGTYKDMDLASGVDSLSRHHHLHISIIGRWLQNATNACAFAGAISSYSSDARHRIDAFESNDRTPFFGFEFFNGKVLSSQGVFSTDENRFWSGSFTADNSGRAACILA